jgi:hypothetical protein
VPIQGQGERFLLRHSVRSFAKGGGVTVARYWGRPGVHSSAVEAHIARSRITHRRR